jgi:urease accessory protein
MKSNVHVDTFNRNGITFLKESFTSMPFKLMDVREDKNQPSLQLMLMSASPGILDGDEYSFNIQVQENCALEISTQSYQRLFNMQNSAIQKTKVWVGKNASFNYLPHPTVPHKNSNFKAVNEIYLSEGAQLIWSDLFSCGRKLNGEAFEYTAFENCTTIYKNDLPVIIEHILYQPQKQLPSIMGHLEGFSHSASVFLIDEMLPIKQMKQKADELLNNYNDIEFGTTEAPINGIIIKILASEADYLFRIIQELVQLLNKEFLLK